MHPVHTSARHGTWQHCARSSEKDGKPTLAVHGTGRTESPHTIVRDRAHKLHTGRNANRPIKRKAARASRIHSALKLAVQASPPLPKPPTEPLSAPTATRFACDATPLWQPVVRSPRPADSPCHGPCAHSHRPALPSPCTPVRMRSPLHNSPPATYTFTPNLTKATGDANGGTPRPMPNTRPAR